MGYTKQAISGFGWNSFLRVTTMGLTIAKISVLARILSPSDFGLFSLIVIALGITDAVTQTGINVTIVQSKQSIKYFLNTAWVIAIIRGLIIGSVMVLIGLFMQNYYSQPQLAILVGLSALIPIIKGFINPAIITMHKELRFFRDSAYHLSLVIVETVTAIILGIIMQSVLALILALIFAAFFEVVISFILFKHRPQFEYLPSRGKIILANAKGLTLSAGLSYIHENIDDFLLGKIIGIRNLGLYHNAYALAHKANYEPAKAIVHSTFPVLTKIVNDEDRLRKGFFKAFSATCLIVALTSLPLLILPEFFVNLILGRQWLEIIPAVKWLVLAGGLQSLSIVIYNLFITKKAYAMMNLHLIISIIILLVLLLILPERMGIEGGGLAVFLSRLISAPILIFGIVRLIKV